MIIILSIRRLVVVVYETHALIVADVTRSTSVGLSIETAKGLRGSLLYLYML